MNRITIFVLFSGAAMFLLAGCTQTLWIQKDFDSIKSDIDTVSIIFPQIEYSVKYGKIEKEKTGFGIYVSKNVAEVLKELIDEKGLISRSALILDDSSIIEQWWLSHFSKSIEDFRQQWDSLQKSPGEKKTLPLTPELKMMVDKIATKYFIFVAGVAFGTSEATKQLDIEQVQTFKTLFDRASLYEYQWSGLQLQIFVVKAGSNEVLWYNYNVKQDSKYDPLDKGSIRNLCLKLLKPE